MQERFLVPLIEDKISSCYSMTEPHGGADPKVFRTSAVQDKATGESRGEFAKYGSGLAV